MLSDRDTHNQPADWFLIASKGDLVLRLVQDLQIGEDGNGGIVLSPARADALLGISPGGRELTLQALALDWTFAETGGCARQYLTFPAGTSVRLNFPTCSLVITPDFLSGASRATDRVIDLKPTTPPAVALTRLSEPITLVDQPVEVAEALPPIGVATTEEIAALLEATSDEISDRLLHGDHDVPDESAAPPAAPHRAAETDVSIRAPASFESIPVLVSTADGRTLTTGAVPAVSDRTRRRGAGGPARPRHRLLAAGLAALALLAPMGLLLEDPGQLAIRMLGAEVLPDAEGARVWPEDDVPPVVAADLVEAPPVSEDLPAQVAPAEDQAQTTAAPGRAFEEPLPLAEQSSQAIAGTTDPVATDSTPTAPPVPAADGSSEAADRTSALSREDAARVESLIAQAQAFLADDAIITPVHENAVDRLSRALALDPTNEEGLRLMYESAARLVEEAQAAHAAGNDYLARNLLEDVLGFHPEFEMARRLQNDWIAESNG